MKIIKCTLCRVIEAPADGFRIVVGLLQDHPRMGGLKGDICTTSAVKLIDFERGYAITENNIYKWKD